MAVVSEEKYHEKRKPVIVTNRVSNLRCGGRINSVDGRIKAHLREAPAVMAPVDKRKVGSVQKKSLSLIGCSGRDDDGDHTTDNRNRAV